MKNQTANEMDTWMEAAAEWELEMEMEMVMEMENLLHLGSCH